eukprot:TRINITY_DN15036_c0_g1_i1.p1 TRINITY_DN15036_c0_g1~~TRINITY_DN15036_c0_g1_i1.p1  ORF type:complete len:496 (-),score=230.85 TRINITY_DN15036_c0_g1_i1:137-1624(-)
MLRALHKTTKHVKFNSYMNYGMMSKYYASQEQDLVVIGAGPGGYVAAIKAAQMGKKVTCVEKRETLGGTCLNVGCIPSKALLNASHKYHDAQHSFKDYGVNVENVTVDVKQMMKQKSDAITQLTGGISYLFSKNKVTWSKGEGSITGPNEVTVVDKDGKKEKINTKNILIATGSDIMSLPGIEIDEKDIISSTGALELKSIPKDMIVIGGGVIGLEMGSVWSRLGSEVTVIEFLPEIAGAGADKDVAKSFKSILSKQGINFKLNTKVTGVSNNGNGTVNVKFEDKKGKQQEMDVEKVLVSIGRRPYTDNLGLENVGVKVEKGKVIIDDKFVTTVPSIRAIGDVVRGPMLAHKAEDEGLAVVEDIFTGKSHINYDAIPSVIYTYPEVAWVGKSEQQLKDAGIEYNVGKFNFSANSRAKTNKETEGFVKFLSDKKTDRILGCSIIGSVAGEMIAEPTLAIEYGASTEDIGRVCHAHPTLTEAVKEAAMSTYDKPIHT